MVVLALHANRRDEAWPGQATIAAFLGCSPDLVGDLLRRLCDDHRLIARTGKIGRACVYTLVSTGEDPLCIPRRLLGALEGAGVLPGAIVTLVAAQAAMQAAPDPTQAQLAERLGIARKRVNPAVNRLVEEGLLRVAHVGLRGLRSYNLADASEAVVPHSGTNKSHGGAGGRVEEQGESQARARAQGQAA
jgi:biotin operon repressor